MDGGIEHGERQRGVLFWEWRHRVFWLKADSEDRKEEEKRKISGKKACDKCSGRR